MTLKDLAKDGESQISKLEGDPIVVARLRELGFVRGERIRMAGRAPFGEPLLVEIRGSTVALRRSEAECVHL